MPVKPILMADIRRTLPSSPAAAHRNSVGTGNYNRFDFLSRQRQIFSTGKRSLPPDDTYVPAPKAPRLNADKVFDSLKENDAILTAAKESLKGATDAFNAFFKKDDGGIGSTLFNLVNAVDLIIKSNENLKSTLIDAVKVGLDPPGQPGPEADPNFSTTEKGKPTGNAYSRAAKAPPPRISPEEAEINKVKQVLREAERKTVIFDLDLGAAPTINKETISRKVTMALHNLAQQGEHDWALNDAAHMLDDVLSCSQLEFLGSGTRKFFNNRDKEDKRNGKMCTVPIRMDFKNKETRSQAEHTLRTICKVSCSTPYPKKLRATLSDLIKQGKALKPKMYIKTKVDIDKLVISAFAKEGDNWTNLNLDTPITPEFLDRYTPIPKVTGPTPMESEQPSFS